MSQINCVDAILFCGEDVILLDRLGSLPGLAMPGGKIDAGETPEEAVVRECKEETGFDVSIVRKVRTVDTPGRDPRGNYVTTVFLCMVVGGVQKDELGKTRVKRISRGNLSMLFHSRDGFVLDHGDILERYVSGGDDYFIPEITPHEMECRIARVKPLHRDDEGVLRALVPVDPHNVSYLWSREYADVIDESTLVPLCDVQTLHLFGYGAFFKPSIAEVLAFLPEEYATRVVGFEMVLKPQHVDDLNREWRATNAGFHVARVRFYGAA